MRKLGSWLKTRGLIGLVLASVAGASILAYAPWTESWHDSFYHLTNEAALIEAIQNGTSLEVLPEIAANLGYGSGIFYPQLFHWAVAGLATVLSPITTNLYYSAWIVHFVFLFLSGVVIYILAKKILEALNQKREPQVSARKITLISLLAACFYMTATYHLVDIIVRDAQAEVMIFTFAPMVLLGLWYLFKNQKVDKWKFYPWFIIGYTGLFYSHLPLTLYFTILLAVVLLVNWRRVFRKEFLRPFLLATLAVVMLVLLFLVPMMVQVLSAQYAVYNGAMTGDVLISGYLYDYLSWGNISSDNGFPITLNLAALVLSLVALVTIHKNRQRFRSVTNYRFIVSALLVFGFGSLILMLHIFPWVIMPDFMLMLQFAWRLNIFLVLALSLAAAVGLFLLSGRLQKFLAVLGVVCCGLSVLQVGLIENPAKNDHVNYETIWSDHDLYSDADFSERRAEDERDFVSGEYDLRDARLMSMGYQGEYLSVKAWQNWDLVFAIGQDQIISIKSGEAQIEVIHNQSPNLELEVTEVEAPVTIELPRLFYAGYTIKAQDTDGVTTGLDYSESDLGLVQFTLDRDAIISVEYTGVPVRKLINALAGATAVTCVVCIYLAREEALGRRRKNSSDHATKQSAPRSKTSSHTKRRKKEKV